MDSFNHWWVVEVIFPPEIPNLWFLQDLQDVVMQIIQKAELLVACNDVSVLLSEIVKGSFALTIIE